MSYFREEEERNRKKKKKRQLVDRKHSNEEVLIKQKRKLESPACDFDPECRTPTETPEDVSSEGKKSRLAQQHTTLRERAGIFGKTPGHGDGRYRQRWRVGTWDDRLDVVELRLEEKTSDKVLKFQLGLWIKERTWRIYIHLYNNRLLSAGSMFFTLGWFCMFTVAVSTFQRALGRRVQVPLTTCCLKLKQTGSPFGAWYQRHVRSFVTIRQVDRKTHRFTAKFKTADHQNGRRGNFRWFYSTLFRGYKQKCAFFLVSRDNQGALFRNWGGTLTSWWLWQILSLVFK